MPIEAHDRKTIPLIFSILLSCADGQLEMELDLTTGDMDMAQKWVLVELYRHSGLAAPKVRKELAEELDMVESRKNRMRLVQVPRGNDRRQPLDCLCSLE